MWIPTTGGSWGTDSDAFVFNLENKYTPNNTSKAIFNYSSGGICFGDSILHMKSNLING